MATDQREWERAFEKRREREIHRIIKHGDYPAVMDAYLSTKWAIHYAAERVRTHFNRHHLHTQFPRDECSSDCIARDVEA